MDGEFSKYLEDVYSAPPVERQPLRDECEILVLGARLAGLLLWYKLRMAGFADVRFCERGGDVGGTWYWNRYPGIACDVESCSYLPLRDCISYSNGEGGAEPGSLAYYGGPKKWHELRGAAQESMQPYVFAAAPGIAGKV